MMQYAVLVDSNVSWIGILSANKHFTRDSASKVVEACWRIGRVDAFRPEGRGFESRSSRHVSRPTLGESFTCSCL